MFEPGPITGIIESNNGTAALVTLADGAQQQLLKCSTQSEAEFLAAFPVGGTASQAKPFVGKFATCLDLVAALEELFSEREIEYGIAGTLDRGNPTDLVMVLTISGLSVLCRPFLESPDGGDGRHFALRPWRAV